MHLLEKLSAEKYLILDGAMGTQIQEIGVPETAWENAAGCNELLNVTAPEIIETIHRHYLEAGADIIKTNTFGCLPWVLDEFDQGHRNREFSRAGAAVAKKACDAFSTPEKPRFVAASLGPGTRLPSLGHMKFDEMKAGYADAAIGVIEGGADLILLETCQDPLQIKAALHGVYAAFDETGKKLPVMVSATIETGGAMLIGTNAATFAAIFEPFDLLSVGLNCGMGPDGVAKHLRALAHHTGKRVSIHSNAGLPLNVGGRTVYPMGPQEFARLQGELAELPGVCFLGGCCGTTPKHIAALAEHLAGKKPHAPTGKKLYALASLFDYKPLFGEKLFWIGERANATGSKAFRELLLAENYEGTLTVAQEQVRAGAHGLDVSVGFAGRDEFKDTNEVVSRYALNIPLPLMVDSTKPEAIETGLKLIGGRPIINSANLEEGEPRFMRIAALAKTYGAALVCLSIDETGMAKTVEKKLEVAERMIALALQAGLEKQDLVFDLLTFTIASGDAEFKMAAMDTMEAIRQLRARHPEVGAVLGVSNVSFGLKGMSREYLNSVFLHHCHQAGLTMGIVNVKSLIAMEAMEAADREICERLMRGDDSQGDPLFAFIDHFEKRAGEAPRQSGIDESLPLPEKIAALLIDGQKEAMLKLLPQAKDEIAPEKIVNELLIGAMKEVGERFGDGRMQLPFVLQSAEVMKAAVDFLAPYLPKKEGGRKLKLVLGTVKGDVHDVGKNLVDIILSNNGFEVINIGIKADYEAFIEALENHDADAVGMSGLLVKSTQVMQENLQRMQQAGIKVPVLLGGAALNRKFVAEYCQSVYDAPVVFCRDAFDGVHALNALTNGTLQKTEMKAIAEEEKPAIKTEETAPLPPLVAVDKAEVPAPPFWGRRELVFDPKTVFEWVDETLLFKTRWGYGKKGEKDYKSLLESEIRPAYLRLKKQLLEEGLFEPIAFYGYWPARSSGEKLLILNESEGWQKGQSANADPVETVADRALFSVDLPRSRKEKRRCLADYFRADRHDTAGFLAVSAGRKLDDYVKTLYQKGQYHEYHLVSGLAGELAEAAAELTHKQMRIDLGLLEGEAPNLHDVKTSGYRGKRYAPGYAACPDLAFNRVIFDLLKPEERGVSLTENYQIDPEASTCAVMAHHPQAEYFAI